MPCLKSSLLVGVVALSARCVAILRGFDAPAVVLERGAQPKSSAHGEKCANLVNKGSHSEIEISVGTPGQKFSVVADTGSNSVIIPSCMCQERGICEKDSRCFRGTGKSETFLLDSPPDGRNGDLLQVMITFGSGPLSAVSSTDVVSVSGFTHKIEGLLLMTDNNLHMPEFEGILGLGTPNSALAAHEDEAEPTERDGINQAAMNHRGNTGRVKVVRGEIDAKGRIVPMDGNEGDEVIREIMKILGGGGADTLAASKPPQMLEIKPRNHNGFMEQAEVEHFSMCFNEKSDGVLRFGDAPTHHENNALNSIGKAHWGLGLGGLSIGSETATLADICSEKIEGAETPCGAIPDSGSTVLMAPKKHILSVFDALCEGWDRCKSNFTAHKDAARKSTKTVAAMNDFDPFGMDKDVSKSFIFQMLLLDCESWMDLEDEAHGLNALPELFFHLGDGKEAGTKLSLSGWSYILEESNPLKPRPDEKGASIFGDRSAVQYLEQDRVAITRARTVFSRFMGASDPVSDVADAMPPGIGDTFGPDKMPMPMHVPESIRRLANRDKTCRPAFDVIDYPTAKNGPVWILGTPVFYAYKVGYGLKSEPPSISFTSVKDSPCGSCGSSNAAASLASDVVTPHRPRRVDVPWRPPTLVDTSLPL
jgi:hypothetical protein